LTSSDVTLSGLLGGASARFKGFTSATDETGNPVSSNVQGQDASGKTTTNEGLTGGGGVVVNVVNHMVQGLVGNLATKATPTVLSTPANISVTSSISETEQEIAQASATRPEGKGNGSAVALAVAVGIYDSSSQAIIEANTVSDAGMATTITSDVHYPVLIDPKQIILGIPAAFVSQGMGELTNLMDGTPGFGTALLTTWIGSQASPDGAGTSSLNGSVAVNLYNNTSQALISGGAQINQAAADQNSSQSVSLSATTEITMIDLVGIGNFGLNANGVKSFQESVAEDGWSKALTGGSLFDVFGRSNGQSIGGSVLFNDLNDTTTAQVEDGAAVYAGSSGGLTINSAKTILRIDIAQAGGLASGTDAKLAFAGSGLGYRDRGTTTAGITTGPLGVTVTGGGPVTISATTGGTQVGIAGAIVIGEGGVASVGISVLVNDIQRTTAGYAGPDPTVDANTTPSGTSDL
jgi:hypothetical protein